MTAHVPTLAARPAVLRDEVFPWVIVPFADVLGATSSSTSARLGVPAHGVGEIEGWLVSVEAITNAAATASGQFWATYVSTTETGIRHVGKSLAAKDEVQRLRDEITRRSRLTRQQIARAVGVDRRSMTSWVNGSSVPGTERLDRLRFLASLVRGMDVVMPGRSTQILLTRRGRGDVLDEIAAGQFDKARDWHPLTDLPRNVRVEHRPVQKAPLYQAALDAYMAGKLAPLRRAHVVRDPDVYEQDLSRAGRLITDDAPRRTRRGYR